MSLAQQFFALFKGLDRAHGWYNVSGKPNDKGKIEGERGTRHTGPTVELWEGHLKGSYGIGIVPILDDATCRWGAIDIDEYKGFDHKHLDEEIRRLGLPLVVCRTKSGGAHCYLFTTEPVKADLVRSKLMEWAVALGWPGVEIFPKQTRLANAESDFGNWINMPYQAGEESLRYAIVQGKSLTPAEFIAHANSVAVTWAQLRELEPAKNVTVEQYLYEAPPCLQILATRGFPEGGRNNALFSFCVYLRKRFPEDWEKRVEVINQKFMDPPLSQREVDTMVKSIGKKAYGYKCKDTPIKDVCNKEVCLTREFGVGGGMSDPGVMFGDLLKIETVPPTWIWSVNGARIELQTAELMDQRQFQRRALEELNMITNIIKPAKWKELLQEKLSKVEVVDVPEDATKEGQLWVHLHRFCTSRVQGKTLDELHLGKPYTDKEKGRTYFCSSDFMQFLQQHRVQGIDEKRLFAWLRERDVEHHKGSIKGKFINYWSVPMFTEQTESHDVPRGTKPEAM